MKGHGRRQGIALGVLVLLALAGTTGCSDAKSEPLELTYYYLPG